jgi:hypothetical protein
MTMFVGFSTADRRPVHGCEEDGVTQDLGSFGWESNERRRREDEQIRLRKEAAARWPKLLEEIRQVPGFEGFALPPSMESLHAAAGDGTVVSIIVTEFGCGALLLNRSDADYLPLPDLTAQDALTRANAFLGGLNPRPGVGVDAGVLRSVLQWLWTAVTGPVLEHLGCGQPTTTDASRWPRLWWIPTGALTVLPLHAAGFHGDPPDTRRAVLDRVVSSYTPSVRALGEARARGMHPVGKGGFAVGINEAPGTSSLGQAEAEADATAKALGTRAVLGPAATRDAVLAALPDAAWAHFACHGLANQDDPSLSFLALYDGHLQVRELFPLELRQPYLAYLSACTTAVGSVRLLDENISLAAAFQLAGYPHVIGTLWRINDFVAADLASDVYQALRVGAGTGRSPALALHDTVRAHRDIAEYSDKPQLWASHIHYGP